MLIKMITIDAGPEGTFNPGSVRNVSEIYGNELIAGGYAVEVKGKAAPAVKVAPVAENKKAPEAPSKEIIEEAPAAEDKRPSTWGKKK